jgi:acyl-CoA hydrolase
VRPGRLLVYADGPDGALPEPELIADLARLTDPEVVLGWVVRRPAWLAETKIPLSTFMVGDGLRHAVREGQVRVVPARLSALPGLLAGRLRPAVAVIGAHEGPGGGWYLAGSAGWAMVAASVAGGVVIERWPGPPPAGSPRLPVEVPLAVYERADPPDPPPPPHATAAHARIGELVADLLPEDATIQWGPGAVGASAVEAIRRPVRVWSGLVTDELVRLGQRGLLAAAADTAYLWGSPELRRCVRLRGVDCIHDLTAISAIERFVAINTALQVGLDGAANVEVAGGRIVSGPGGHPDFAAGASRSVGGLSIVALPSTSGGRSTIVARPEVVTTPRSDVDVVVTEHGLADLRGSTDQERASRLIDVADPEHRDELRREATRT